MMGVHPVVAVIDDDLSVREALKGLLETAALEVELFSSPREYLQKKRTYSDNYLIDVRAGVIMDVEASRDPAG